MVDRIALSGVPKFAKFQPYEHRENAPNHLIVTTKS